MPSAQVFISTDVEFNGETPAPDLLTQAGFQVHCQTGTKGWPNEETRARLPGVDAFLAGGEYFNAETLDQADRLKIIARNGVGYDRIDLDLCTQRGIIVTNTPGAMADAVADEALALMLALIRHLLPGDRTVKAGGYDVPVGEDLAAMTLGLVGCGLIGSEVARRAAAFKMRILVHDPWADADTVAALGAELVALDQLLAQSHVVSLHTPLTDANAGMVDGAFLQAMPRGSFLINTARGGLVDEAALISALQSGHLAGAGLDCQASEPPQGLSLELVRLDQVLAMPHSASKTLTARRRMSLVAAQGIAQCLQGKVPDHVVNKAVLDNLSLT
ncbi:MAG: hypothetical protein GKR89_05975 [Candidatus Latescibacteria bacterium]|nr:hypothetical protein [Candidatus Latescibacterota bacterium]